MDVPLPLPSATHFFDVLFQWQHITTFCVSPTFTFEPLSSARQRDELAADVDVLWR
jgi:hypothetical protein